LLSVPKIGRELICRLPAAFPPASPSPLRGEGISYPGRVHASLMDLDGAAMLANATEEDRFPVGRAGFKPVGTRQACLVGSTPTLFRQSPRP